MHFFIMTSIFFGFSLSAMSTSDARFIGNIYLNVLPFELHKKLLCFYANQNNSLMGYVALLAKNDEEITHVALFGNRVHMHIGISLNHNTQPYDGFFMYQKNKHIMNFYNKLGFRVVLPVNIIDRIAYFNFVKEMNENI